MTAASRRSIAAAAALALISLASQLLGGCGYSLSASPYQLDLRGETLTLAVPVAANRSRFGRLGTALTEAVIERL